MKALSFRGPMADRMIRGRRGILAVAAAILLASGAIASAQEAGFGAPATVAPVAPAPVAQPAVPSASEAPAAPPASNPSSAAAPAMAPSSPALVGAPQETAPAAAPSLEVTSPIEAGEVPAADEAPAATGALPHDLSPWGMFLAADYVVKAVMLGLAFASLVTWTIWLAKVLELAAAKRRALAGVKRLGSTAGLPAPDGLDAAGWRRGPVAALVRAAVEERAKSADLPADGVKERAAAALHRIEARAGRRMTRGTGLLATIGSTAPFVGLFGTVWGIMNSFIGISQANTTNLAVVAPGIAEALLATAIGLVAAIPAVIIYNVFARAIAGYKAVLSDASAGVLQHLSRDLDRAKFAARPAGGRPSLQAAE